jgi:hypothetical protein
MKPRIKFSPIYRTWGCYCKNIRMIGTTPREAFDRWKAEAHIRAIMAANV